MLLQISSLATIMTLTTGVGGAPLAPDQVSLPEKISLMILGDTPRLMRERVAAAVSEAVALRGHSVIGETLSAGGLGFDEALANLDNLGDTAMRRDSTLLFLVESSVDRRGRVVLETAIVDPDGVRLVEQPRVFHARRGNSRNGRARLAEKAATWLASRLASRTERAPPIDLPQSNQVTTSRPDDAAEVKTQDKHPTVRARAGLVIGGRNLSYRDVLSSNILPYQLTAAPALSLATVVFPLRRFTSGAWRNIGVQASYERSAEIRSRAVGSSEGATVATEYSTWLVGARFELPFSTVPIGLAVSHGLLRFALDGQYKRDLPNVRYRNTRIEVDAGVQVGVLNLAATLGVLHLARTGAIGQKFSRSRSNGLVSELAAALPIADRLRVRVAARYLHILHDLRPKPGDAYVAGGALDQFYGLETALEFTL